MTDTPDNVVPVEEMNRRRRVNELADQVVDLWRDLAERERELREMGVPTETWMEVASTRFTNNNIAERISGGIPILAHLVELIVKFGARTGPSYEPLDFGKIFKGGAWASSSGAGFSLADLLPLALNGLKESFPSLAAMFGGKAPVGGFPPGYEPVVGEPPEPVSTAGGNYVNMSTIPMYRLIQRLFAEAPKLENTDGTPREDQAPAIECAIMFKGGHGIQGALAETPEGTLRMLVFGQDPKSRELVTIEHFFKYDDVVDIAVPRKSAVSEGSRIHTS